MFISSHELKLKNKVLSKRINRQLFANFFTIEEFKNLSNRKAYKVIKIISKIENIQLKRFEIKAIVNFIKSDFESKKDIQATSMLWNFVIDTIIEKANELNEYILESEKSFIKYFRFGKYDLQII